MVAPTVISWLSYGWETSYGAETTASDKAFGHGVRVTSLSRRNNVEKVYSAGFRNAQKLVPKAYEGGITTEFVLANPWFFRAVLGAAPTDGGATPFTHTYTESDTVDSFTINNTMAMASGNEAALLGCKVASCTLTSAVNELVRVRLDSQFADETLSGSTGSKVSDSFDLYTYAQGSIEIPDAATLAMVQNFEMTINNNPEAIQGQGSRFAQDMPVKNREYTTSMTMALQTKDQLEDFYGQASSPADIVSELADMTLQFTNGLTGTNERTIALSATGIMFDEESLPQDPTSVIMEDIQISFRELSVVASDATETAL